MSATCTFQKSLVVTNCPDWSQLIIDPGNPTTQSYPGIPSSFTPASGSMQSFTCQAGDGGPFLFQNASAFCTATLHNYNGPACNALISVNWSTSGFGFGTNGSINVSTPGPNLNLTVADPNGPYTLALTIPDGTAVPYDIVISVSCITAFAQAGPTILSGSIANV